MAFARAAAWLAPPPSLAEGVHPTAVIAESARLSRGAAVGPFAVIEEEVEVGEGAQIGAFCFVGRGALLGERLPAVSSRHALSRGQDRPQRHNTFGRGPRV